MADPKNPDTKGTKNKKMTKADAAKLVKRMVPVIDEETGQLKRDKDGEIVTKAQAIKESEVLNFAEYPDKVVVVTIAGEKLVYDK